MFFKTTVDKVVYCIGLESTLGFVSINPLNSSFKLYLIGLFWEFSVVQVFNIRYLCGFWSNQENRALNFLCMCHILKVILVSSFFRFN